MREREARSNCLSWKKAPKDSRALEQAYLYRRADIGQEP